LDPECVEAWLLRAEGEEEAEAALNVYRKAVKNARSALGEEFFREEEGRFWEVLETRTYMRARLGEALCLYELRREDKAARVLEEMLRLNPADDQGVRYILLSMLIEVEQYDAAETLLEEYAGDVSPVWLYGRALAGYLRHGPTMARPLRDKALKNWPAVADYLGNVRDLPDDRIADYDVDELDEEMICALETRSVWKKSPKALAWLLEGRNAD